MLSHVRSPESLTRLSPAEPAGLHLARVPALRPSPPAAEVVGVEQEAQRVCKTVESAAAMLRLSL